MKDNSEVLSGELTWEKWLVWLNETRHNYDTARTQQVYTQIEQSKTILKEFLSYPSSIQNKILRHVDWGSDILGLETSIELRLILDSRTDDSINGIPFGMIRWLSATSTHFTNFACSFVIFPFEDFRYVADMIDHYSWSRWALGYDTDREIWRACLWMLVFVHGAPVMKEIFEVWDKNRIPHPIEKFKNLPQNWDKVKKYPLEWAIELAGRV